MSRQALYTGKSGQLAVMAEFVSRGYNVAVPEVDVGDDLFVVRDADGELSRVQVKTANARATQGGHVASFKVPLRQLETPHRPDMNYVFVVRVDERWSDFVLVDRKALYDLHVLHGVGRAVDGHVLFELIWHGPILRCCDHDLQSLRNNWSRWPPIRHGLR